MSYKLLAASADAQFSEVLEVFGLSRAVENGESRCGICNARAWRTLRPEEVRGRVPPEVGAKEGEFFECGSCGQIFWPGEKYVETMDALRSAVSERGTDGG